VDAGSIGNVELLMRLMNASAQRARVIASNVANENTPGYSRQVLRFEDLLRDELAGGAPDLARVAPRIEADAVTPARPDGNNVNLELELGADRQNRLLYESYAAILQSHYDLLGTAIESGR
jgi:flagellar basal-body rod protein FlgB